MNRSKIYLTTFVSLFLIFIGGCDEGLVQPEPEEQPVICLNIPSEDAQPGPRPDLQEDFGYAHFQSLLDYYMATSNVEKAWSLCDKWRDLNGMVRADLYSPEPRGCPTENPFE